jgi:GT2 family glycosyltransferase
VEKVLNLLDIIIVNYNSTDYLLTCLRSVYDSLQGLPAKVFVQDNASEDNVDRVNEMFPKVLLSKNSYNMGFSKAANNAMKQSTAPYIVLLNPDTHVTHGFFECVLRYMEENPDVGIVGPKVLNRDGSVQGSARSFPTLLTAFFGRNSLLTRWFPNNRVTRQHMLTTGSDGVTPMAVDWVSGACMVVRKKAFEDVGFMDECFFMYWEDVDWCKRIWHSGWKVVYFPQASIVHYVGGSSDKLVIRSVFEFHKSCYRFFNKYTKFPLSVVSPLVFWGIALRFFFVLFFHKMR